MTWPHIALAAAGLATMRAAIDRGDLDDAAHQGALAGPAVIEAALTAPDRSARLAAIVAAPRAESRAELLDPLATTAGGPDRRVAIPAALAAREIARELTDRSVARADLPDDLAPEDLATWQREWAALALRADRWIELRIAALDVAAALDPARTGVELATALADPDPAFRRAAIAILPAPVPLALRPALAGAVAKDTDDAVALDAANILCADLAREPPQPILTALGPAGLQRIRTLATDPKLARDARRCLGATPARVPTKRPMKKR